MKQCPAPELTNGKMSRNKTPSCYKPIERPTAKTKGITPVNFSAISDKMGKIKRRTKDIETLESMRRDGRGEIELIFDSCMSYEKNCRLYSVEMDKITNAIIGVLQEELDALYKEVNEL
ncbi:MAG: hypothetical protein J6U45_01700 [Alistipes sp.]|nr:hypothetical protein [Alistipes sp.]